jgi:hypothetical protein
MQMSQPKQPHLTTQQHQDITSADNYRPPLPFGSFIILTYSTRPTAHTCCTVKVTLQLPDTVRTCITTVLSLHAGHNVQAWRARSVRT